MQPSMGIEQCAKFDTSFMNESLTSMIILWYIKELKWSLQYIFDLDECIPPSVGKEPCTIFRMCILEDGTGDYHNPLGHASDLASFLACVNKA